MTRDEFWRGHESHRIRGGTSGDSGSLAEGMRRVAHLYARATLSQRASPAVRMERYEAARAAARRYGRLRQGNGGGHRS